MRRSSPPTVFISSTIYDFRDLRSSLKWWFERMGYVVNMSEYTDFEKPVEANSYDACFEAIRSSQVFILLVGERRGGWYEKDNHVSITQQEYRIAYQEAKEGRLTLIPFVRAATQDCIAYYSKLREKLKKTDGMASELHKATSHIQDPEHLRQFLREIGRVKDMLDAAKVRGARPPCNWIYKFNNFSEILDALRVSLRIRKDVATEALLDAASREIVHVLRHCAIRLESGMIFCTTKIASVVEELKLDQKTVIEKASETLALKPHQCSILLTAVMQPSIKMVVPLTALQQASVHSGLSEYHPESQTLTPSPLQLALQRTYQFLAWVTSTGFQKQIAEAREKYFSESMRNKNMETRRYTYMTVVLSLGVGLQLDGAIREAVNVLRHIRFGTNLDLDPRRDLPITPFLDEEGKIKSEEVTEKEFIDFLRPKDTKNRLFRESCG